MASDKDGHKTSHGGYQPVIRDTGRDTVQRGHQPKVTMPPKLNPPKVGSSVTPPPQSSPKKN